MILFIDACARKDSRTRKVSEYLLGKMNGEIQTLKLYEENLPILDETYLSKRTDACNNNNYFLECFKYAKQFAMADDIVIAAPYWDLSFPAVLKTYIENICVTGITFKYSEEGFPVGLCNGKNVFYVTTAGGKIINDSFGYGYIQSLAKGMFGIQNCYNIFAEELDIVGKNVEEILNNTYKIIDNTI